MDTDLVVRAQRGDKEPYALLAARIADGFLAIARRILRDRDLAEDATQQALLSVWQDLPRLKDPARFEAWSYRLLVHACYAEGRKERRWAPNLHMLPTDEGMSDAGFGAVVGAFRSITERWWCFTTTSISRSTRSRGSSRSPSGRPGRDSTSDPSTTRVAREGPDRAVGGRPRCLGPRRGCVRWRAWPHVESQRDRVDRSVARAHADSGADRHGIRDPAGERPCRHAVRRSCGAPLDRGELRRRRRHEEAGAGVLGYGEPHRRPRDGRGQHRRVERLESGPPARATDARSARTTVPGPAPVTRRRTSGGTRTTS